MADDSLSRPERANWAISSRSQSKGLYALALIDTKFANVAATGIQNLGTAAQASGYASEFIFDMNPKTLDLEEPAAVQIVPTQDGGQFIEHQGQIYKNVTITGTTGLRPNKKTNIIPVLGVTNPFAANLVDQTTGVPPGEKTGFDSLLELRNLFRRYFDLKADPKTAHTSLMVWQNGKEGEFYVVEPQTFRTKRDASSPLTSSYEIQLRTIGRVDFKLFRTPDPRAEMNSLQRFMERMNGYSRSISQALGTLNALADRVVGVAQATLTTVIGPARALADGITGFVTTASSSFAIPRNTVALLAGSAIELAESLNRAQSASNAYKLQGITTQLSAVVNAFKLLERTAANVAAEDQLFSAPAAERFNNRASAYKEPTTGRPPRTGGSPTNMNNLTAASGSGLAVVFGHDNIFSLSQRLLGDQARWKELVMLNDLKAPYIDPTGDGKNVLRPGQNILFPVAGGTLQTGVSPSRKVETDHLVTRLGRDLRLRADSGAGGIVVYDLSENARGDLDTIEGMPNLEQAVEIKFSTEQGELPTHPEFGLQVPIGSKALVRTLVGFQMNARASLLADSRISNVRQLGFQLSGNTVNVTADLDIADVDQSVAISFDARR